MSSADAAAPATGPAKRGPNEFLKSIIGRPVQVKLNSGVVYKGKRRPVRKLICAVWHCQISAGVLACLDGFMNIAMEQTEEYVDGKLSERFGDAFIRGNNGESSRVKCPEPPQAGMAHFRAVLYISGIPKQL